MKRKNKTESPVPELIIEDITDTAEDLIVDDTSDLLSEESKESKESSEKSNDESDKTEKTDPIDKTDKISNKDPDDIKPEKAKAEKNKSDGSESDDSKAEETKAEKDSEEKISDVKESEDSKKSSKSDESDKAEEDKPKGRVIIDMKNIIKRYFIGQPNELEVLHGIDLQVHEGEFVAIVGQSGSGKSTLMNVIGALDRPTEGEYMLDGVDMFKAKDKDLSAIRCKKIGFVFQTYNLVARTSALKNVELPMLYSNTPRGVRTKRAKDLLAMVEMEERMKHSPDELSGGQKQRVAIARAMANDPALILADEPTGALDSNTGRLIMDIFHRLHKEQGKTIILITHSPELAEECERILTLKDGMFIGERKGSGKSAVL